MKAVRMPRSSQCEGKQKLTAHEAANRTRQLQLLGHALNTYQCPHCGTYHLGHVTKTDSSESISMYDELAAKRRQRIARLREQPRYPRRRG